MRGQGEGGDMPESRTADTAHQVESSGWTARAPSVYLLTVSCPLELSLQSFFNFPLLYLSTIDLMPVLSLRWSLPPTFGCIPKQPDSEKTRYQQPGSSTDLTMSLSVHRSEGLGPSTRATLGSGSSIHHIFRTPPWGRDLALGSSLFTHHY